MGGTRAVCSSFQLEVYALGHGAERWVECVSILINRHLGKSPHFDLSIRVLRNLGSRVEAERSCKSARSAPHTFNFRILQGFVAELGRQRMVSFALIVNPMLVV